MSLRVPHSGLSTRTTSVLRPPEISAFDASSANEILDRDSAGWHPMMLRIRAETVAVRGGAMPEHDASDAVARRCRQMPWVAAFVIDECRHERASPDCNDRVTITMLRTNARSGRPLLCVRPKLASKQAITRREPPS